MVTEFEMYLCNNSGYMNRDFVSQENRVVCSQARLVVKGCLLFSTDMASC